jgi:two-component system, NarL family, nitrate/nitrite response regulator NarL
VRIVLGDRHRLFIDALAAALTQDGVTVAVLATSPQDVLAAVARRPPDICLLATRLRISGDLDILAAISSRYPQVKVVMMSDSSDPDSASAAIEGGAAGVIEKDQHLADIVRTLARVRAGELAHGTALARSGPGNFGPPVSGDSDWLLRLLTVRERQVLMLMMEGESTGQIARSLAIALSTARTHVQSVLVKLGAHSQLEATSMVARSCLIGISGEYSLGSGAQQAAASG